jgi:RNA polymerase sigma-70 factor, ECF subfamily
MYRIGRQNQGMQKGVPMADDECIRISRDAFAGIVMRHQQDLCAFLTGCLNNTEQVHDVIQDTFSDAWQATQRVTSPFTTRHDEQEIRRWLFRTAYRQAIDSIRHHRIIQWEPLSENTVGDLAAPAFEDRVIESETLKAALAELSLSDVACLQLRVVLGFSAAEAATIMETTPALIDKRLSRARQRLRASYIKQQHLSPEERSHA